ncbi:hypothetical protein Dsin_007574 [Dipteronia sinensis]|uniref:Uncharacterized protein n=1 Tax=Dipteronia sinensis TaxID=43782 RepID=A0AAE0B1P1_9ROSI|nr:hypothetical protein Dsin_007574 [Dipteronia sinensis]
MACPIILQATPIAEYYPAPFGDSYETDASIFCLCPAFDAISPYQEETDASIFCLCPAFDAISPSQEAAAYEGQQQLMPFNGYGNWLSDHGPCYGRSWGDSFFSYSYDSDINGSSGGTMVKTEDDHQMQAQYESDFSYQEDDENQPTFDYNACYDSCIAYIESEQEEVRPAYRYGLDEVRFCEGMFGYWPCMFREVQQAYVEQ